MSRSASRGPQPGLWLSFFDLALAGRPNRRTQELLIPEANRKLTRDVGSVWQVTRPPDRLAAFAVHGEAGSAAPIGIGQALGWVKFSAKMMLKSPLTGLKERVRLPVSHTTGCQQPLDGSTT